MIEGLQYDCVAFIEGRTGDAFIRGGFIWPTRFEDDEDDEDLLLYLRPKSYAVISPQSCKGRLTKGGRLFALQTILICRS